MMISARAFRLGELAMMALWLLLWFWLLVRFGVFLPRRTRGWQDRLLHPTPPEVEARWKVHLPPSLEMLFRADWIQRRDFYLAPFRSRRSEWLWIDHFIPLTARDVSAWLVLTSVPGIPIAMDGHDRAYYLPFADLRRGGQVSVWLDLGDCEYKEVASSIDQWITFEPKTMLEYNTANNQATA
jgi:hypothetical protein